MSPHGKTPPSLAAQGKYDEAKPLYKGSLAVMEKAVGHDHPEVALVLNNLAMLLQSQVRVGLVHECRPFQHDC